MSQTKQQSFVEALSNVFLGFITTLIFSPLIYWLADVKVNYFEITHLTLLFTILSVARSYVVRRWFNKKEIK